MLRAVLLIARPPLLAVMQGGDYRLISIHSLTFAFLSETDNDSNLEITWLASEPRLA
jgi:hypothetical protein